MKFYKLINLNKFNTLRVDNGALVVDDVRMEMADKPGEGQQRWVHNAHTNTVHKATPVQLTRSISTQQSSLRQRQDQLAKEKESKRAVLLDTPPVTGKDGRKGVKKPPQPRPASIPTSSTTTPTAASTPTPTTHPDNLAPLKNRLVHLLALKSVEASEACSKLHAHADDIHYLLNQVAYSQKSMQASTPIYHLKHELWDDVDVDSWTEYSDAEKHQVAAAVKRKTGKMSKCLEKTIAPAKGKDKEREKEKEKDERDKDTEKGKKAAPAKTRQNLLRASQGKKVSRSPSPAKAMLNAKDKDKDKEKDKDAPSSSTKSSIKNSTKIQDKDKDKDAQSSTSSRSPSVLSTHSSSAASKESSTKRKRQDEEANKGNASASASAQNKSAPSKRMKKGEWACLRMNSSHMFCRRQHNKTKAAQ